MNKSKLASITISMSWIFMIVIGSFFLLFAYNVISKYQSIQDDKFNLELKWGLRSIFNEVGRTSGIEETKLNVLTRGIFKNKRVEILCLNDEPILSINGELDANNEFLQNYPTFMTVIDQGKKENLYLAVESFRMPFKTTSVLALISKKNLIVFDENSVISDQLIEKFKKSSYSQLNYVTEDLETLSNDVFLNSIKDKNYNSVMFVSDEGKSFDTSILDEIKINSYYVNFKQLSSNTGNIFYQSSNGSKINFTYIDWDESKTLQTMAVFSAPKIFDCSYNLLIKNTKDAYEFYKIKTQRFSNLSFSNQLCSGNVALGSQNVHYSLVEEKINNIQGNLTNEKFNKASFLMLLIEDLEAYQETLGAVSCPYIY